MNSGMTPRNYFYRWRVGVALLLIVVFAALFHYTDIDRYITNLFYDATTQEFPWRSDWWIETILHEWAKYLLVLLTLATGTGFLASFAIDTMRAYRRSLLFLVLVMTVGTATVAELRHLSNSYCPFELSDYGGYAASRRPFQHAEPGVQRGQCAPSRHAAGGFGLMTFYFLWWRRRRALSYAALATGIAFGTLLGLARVAQGAIFLSYVVWAGLVVWLVALAIYRVVLHRDDFRVVEEVR